MRKLILMAIATYVWKKFQSRPRSDLGSAGRMGTDNPTPPRF